MNFFDQIEKDKAKQKKELAEQNNKEKKCKKKYQNVDNICEAINNNDDNDNCYDIMNCCCNDNNDDYYDDDNDDEFGSDYLDPRSQKTKEINVINPYNKRTITIDNLQAFP